MAEQPPAPAPRPGPADARAEPPNPPGAVTRWRPGSLVADRFRLGRLLGSGAMGEVWSACDLELDETVALKRLREQSPDDRHLAALFRREVRLARRVSHPNVARVFELVVLPGEGRLFLTMEYVRGHTLAEHLRRLQPLSAAAVVHILRAVSAGLGAVHEAGIVHRDIKPANVMLGEGDRVVLMDFGVALAVRESLSEGGQLLGTPAYMAPELLEGATASVASDVYALGCLGFELLTRRRVFDADRGLALLRDQKVAPPRLPDPAEVPGLSAVIEACLAPDPAARLPSAAALEAALARLRVPEPLAAPAVPPAMPPEPPTLERTRTRLAILPFEAVGAEVDLVELLSDDFASELGRHKPFSVLAAGSVRKRLRDAGAAPASWGELGALLGANVVICGEVRPEGDDLGVTLRALSVPEGRLLWRWRGEVSLRENLPSMAAAARDLARAAPFGDAPPDTLADPGASVTPTSSGPPAAPGAVAAAAASPTPGAVAAAAAPPALGALAAAASPDAPATLLAVPGAPAAAPAPPPVAPGLPPASIVAPPAAPGAPPPSSAGAFELPSQAPTLTLRHLSHATSNEAPTRAEVGRGEPGRVLDLYLRGRTLLMSSSLIDIEGSIACFEEALELAREDPRIASSLALALARHHFLSPEASAAAAERAERAAEHALRVAPSMGEPHHARAVLLMHQGRPAEAVRSLRQALRCTPSLASAHFLLGQVLLEAGYEIEGRRRLAAAERLEPGGVEGFWALYRFAVLAGDDDEAEAQREALLRAEGGVRSRWYLHLRVAAWRGDRDELRRVVHEATERLTPRELLPPFRAYVSVALRGEDPALAFALLRRSAAESGASHRARAFVYQLLAEVACLAGDAREAASAIALARDAALFDRPWLERCPLLAPVRHTPEFGGALESARAHAEAMHQAYFCEG
ncbi:MAG TPA: protein kinase [Polyangiaceae bacterium]|nr:protein kinase [Polyangiaceae bacterium]